jgi:hypothetical protein
VALHTARYYTISFLFIESVNISKFKHGNDAAASKSCQMSFFIFLIQSHSKSTQHLIFASPYFVLASGSLLDPCYPPSNLRPNKQWFHLPPPQTQHSGLLLLPIQSPQQQSSNVHGPSRVTPHQKTEWTITHRSTSG